MTLPIRAIVLTSLFGALAAAPAAAQTPAQPECSAVIKNPACTVTINRESPSTPQPFLMTGHATITMSIRKRPFDKIEVNSMFTDVVPVDPLAAIIGAFAPSFASVKFTSHTSGEVELNAFTSDAPPKISTNPKVLALLLDLAAINRQQLSAQASLADAKTSLDGFSKALAAFSAKPAGTWTDTTLEPSAKLLIDGLSQGEDVAVPSAVVAALGEAVDSARKKYAAWTNANPPIQSDDLVEVGDALNQVDAHQTRLDASAKSLVEEQDSLRTARVMLETINKTSDSRANALLFTTTIETNAHGPARSVKSTVTMTNALSKDKTDLGTVSASWNSTPWEVSAGTVFSTRPITSYGVANSVITESNTRPMVVPFALAHYNLWETTAGRYRVALLASGGMGVNTNTKSADFGYGLSLSYRGVYLSGLNHKARETVLSGGLAAGQTVASSVTTAPTELKWKSKFRLGIALTLRVPF